MKSTFSILVILFLLAGFTGITNAQKNGTKACTSCTMTITTNWTSPIVANSGMVICVGAGGSISGDILINGGSLCNEGSITSHNILILSGSLSNQGNMNIVNCSMSSGIFENNGKAEIDSLSQQNADFFNNDSLICVAHSIYNQSAFINNDYYECPNTSAYYGSTVSNEGWVNSSHISVFFADSAITTRWINGSTGHINCDSISVCDAIFENYGSMLVGYDMSIGCGATFFNYEYCSIGQDFSIDTSSAVYTACLILVERNWANYGSVNGPDAGCGGFSVNGLTGNFGVFGGSGHVDMCDAGNPGGFDINTGSLGSNVTFCTCTDTCEYHAGINEEISPDRVSGLTAYPNPFNDRLSLRFELVESTKVSAEIFDIYGRKIYQGEWPDLTGNNVLDLPWVPQSNGLYLLILTAGNSSSNIRIIKN